MEFIADGETPDTAWLEFDGVKYDLMNKSSDVSRAVFAFPAELAGIEPGTQVLFRMESRGGIADGQVYPSKKTVTVIAGDTPVTPTVDSIASEGKDGIVKGEDFAAVGANLSWHEGDSVTVKWTEGGEEKSLEVTPKATTPTKMDFDAVDAFDDIPDDTELTFEFELGGETAEGETRILGE